VGTLRETADKFLAGRLSAGRLSEEGHHAGAEKLYWGNFGDSVARPWTRKPIPVVSKANLADVLFEEGHVQEAGKLHRETLETMVRTLGPEHPGTLQAHTNLARTLIREGRYAEAEKMLGRLSTPSFVIWGRSIPLAWMHCSNSG
jgi:hypothetical protein